MTTEPSPVALRLRTRHVAPEELLPEEDVRRQGFAGHYTDDFPEPARSYKIVFSRLERIWQELTFHTPLLVCVEYEMTGIMNSVWSTRVGIVPVRRINHDTLEVIEKRVTFLTGDTIEKITFAMDEVLVTVPPWCK